MRIGGGGTDGVHVELAGCQHRSTCTIHKPKGRSASSPSELDSDASEPSEYESSPPSLPTLAGAEAEGSGGAMDARRVPPRGAGASPPSSARPSPSLSSISVNNTVGEEAKVSAAPLHRGRHTGQRLPRATTHTRAGRTVPALRHSSTPRGHMRKTDAGSRHRARAKRGEERQGARNDTKSRGGYRRICAFAPCMKEVEGAEETPAMRTRGWDAAYTVTTGRE